jgi:MSHA biogenesis protein MshL
MNNKQKIIGLLGILPMLLTSCASVPEDTSKDTGPDLSVLGSIQSSLDVPAWQDTQSQLPESVSDALLPSNNLNMPAGSVEKVEPRFDISVNRANARSFFISLVKNTPYNIVVHPDVKGKITLNLKDVTIPEVMEIAYNSYGYEYEKTANGFVVHPNKIQSRMYKINYLNVTRQGQSATRVSSGQPTDSTNNSKKNGNTTTSQSKTQSVLAASNITTESKLDFWSEIRASVESILGTGEGRSVVVSPQSGLIIIRGYPSELRMAENYLSSAELIMQRQVILEAKIIEVELKDGYQQGINWADLSNSGNTLAGQTGGGTLLQDGVSSIAGNTGNLDPGNFSQLAGNAVSAFGGMFTLAVKSGNFAAFFEFLQTQGNMQVLSSPRVSTVNNQKAVIKVGSDEFFVTDVSSTTTSGVATTTTPNVTLTPFFSGISLDVTPQIDDKGKIILHIHPTISNVVDQEKTIAVGADVLSLPLAFSQVRESDSIVSARNGEIVIIGGLMTEKLVEKEAGTPILSSIPLLGNLFKHTSQEKVKSELVILLKPIVIDNQNSWSKAIGESSTRVKQIYHEYNQ